MHKNSSFAEVSDMGDVLKGLLLPLKLNHHQARRSMRRIIGFIMLTIPLCLPCIAQEKCKMISLGQLVEKISSIDFSHRDSLIYKKYSSFSFSEFEPLGEGKETEDGYFFKIGFNGKGEIKEIVYASVDIDNTGNEMLGIVSYLKVYDFQSYRILIPLASIKLDCKDECSYYSTAILMDKLNRYNYLISTHYPPNEKFWNLMVSEGGMDIELENLSTIMVLDEDLYPTTLLKILKGRVVFSSEIRYRKDHIVDYSLAYLFFSPELHKNLAISFDSCPETIVANCGNPEMIVELKPREFGESVGPLWNLIGEW